MSIERDEACFRGRQGSVVGLMARRERSRRRAAQCYLKHGQARPLWATRELNQLVICEGGPDQHRGCGGGGVVALVFGGGVGACWACWCVLVIWGREGHCEDLGLGYDDCAQYLCTGYLH